MSNSEDPAIVRAEPTFAKAENMHPLAAKLALIDTDPNCFRFQKAPPLPPPEVTAAGVEDLHALFGHSLTPEEVAFAVATKEREDKEAAPSDNKAPRHFLQSHNVIIEQLLMNPGITTTRLASVTGYSRAWLHKLMSSDAFQAKLAEKQKQYLDPIILETVQLRLQGITSRTIEILEERLESDKVSVDTALSIFRETSKALGMGQHKPVSGATNNFIVTIPAQMTSASQWAQKHGGEGAGANVATTPIDITPGAPASLAEHTESSNSLDTP